MPRNPENSNRAGNKRIEGKKRGPNTGGKHSGYFHERPGGIEPNSGQSDQLDNLGRGHPKNRLVVGHP